VGEILGKSYVSKYFTPEAKDKALAMVEQLRTTLRDRVTKLTWMEEATKGKALAKLEKFKVKIGYPTKWRNYDELDLSGAESYYGALQICENFEFGFQLAKAYQPVDPTEWLMNPHTVNAYYHPINNEIVFPAGILQEPFFQPEPE
jgi:putative endopeptidase